MSDPKDDRTNLLLLIVVGLVWGSAYPVIEYGIQAGATPIAFAAARYALSAIVIAALAAATKVARPTARSLAGSAVLGLPIVGIYGLLLYVGETTTSGALAAIVICVAPLLTALVALPVLPNESLGRAGVLGLVVGFVGVVVLVFPPPGVVLAESVWGPVEVLAAAVSVAVGTVVLRRVRPDGETLWGASVQFGAATVFLLAVLPVLEPHSALPLTGPSLGSVAFLVAGPSLVGYSLYFYLHHRVGPGRANIVAYVNPLAAVTLGTLVFAEPFEPWELAGFALVLVGVTIVTRYGKTLRAPATAPEGTDAPNAPTARERGPATYPRRRLP